MTQNNNGPRQDVAERFINLADLIIKPLVVISIGMFLIELKLSLHHDWENSVGGFIDFIPIKEWQRERERIVQRKRANRVCRMKD